MDNMDIVEICEKVLDSLSIMDYEKIDKKRKVNKSKSLELNKQLIFPMKIQGKELNKVDRISEQELRQLFIEEFKETYKEKDKDLYFSIETPTLNKYRFGTKYGEIEVNENGQSALLDMCIFKRDGEKYNRVLNIEFKHQNAALKNIAKDILKLMHEEQNGAFILLLKNTDSGTLCNKGKTGVLDKLSKSFSRFEKLEDSWKGNDAKYIKLIIISLKQQTLIHYTVIEDDLDNLKMPIFSENAPTVFGNITTVIGGNGWEIEPNK
jgi:hypothetical protein